MLGDLISELVIVNPAPGLADPGRTVFAVVAGVQGANITCMLGPDKGFSYHTFKFTSQQEAAAAVKACDTRDFRPMNQHRLRLWKKLLICPQTGAIRTSYGHVRRDNTGGAPGWRADVRVPSLANPNKQVKRYVHSTDQAVTAVLFDVALIKMQEDKEHKEGKKDNKSAAVNTTEETRALVLKCKGLTMDKAKRTISEQTGLIF